MSDNKQQRQNLCCSCGNQYSRDCCRSPQQPEQQLELQPENEELYGVALMDNQVIQNQPELLYHEYIDESGDVHGLFVAGPPLPMPDQQPDIMYIDENGNVLRDDINPLLPMPDQREQQQPPVMYHEYIDENGDVQRVFGQAYEFEQ
jgi:hypothetical protein